MNEQALDLRGFWETIRRQMAVLIAIATLVLLAGVGYTLRYPPLPTSNALVLLPSAATRFIGTQVVVATSEPVLVGALGEVRPPVTMQILRSRVKATSLTSGIISISASGQTAAQAKSAANAVTESYVSFIGTENNALGSFKAEVLSPASDATKGSFWIHLVLSGGAGLLLGTVIGAIVAFAIGRNRRPIWLRSEIAKAVGVQVLASIPVSHPSGPGGWARLFEQYQPSAADAGSLRHVLHQVGLSDAQRGYRGQGDSVVRVFSLDSDPRALAVGPQLAVFAASSGIPTTLIIDLREEAKMTPRLRAAYSATRDLRQNPAGILNVGILDSDDDDWVSATPLAVIVSVVSGRTRLLTQIRPTTAALLAVSAGAATGEQLARIAVCITATGKDLVGTIVADPDAADFTTGRLFRPEWAADRLIANGQVAMTMETRL